MTETTDRSAEHREAFPEDYPQVEIVTGGWLDEQVFPPIRWVVPGLIAEGLTVLVGAPKLGKSWLALALGLAAATGGNALGCIPMGRPRPVLYLALEDGYRRLQGRSRHLLPEGERIPEGLEIIIKGTPSQLRGCLGQWLDEQRHTAPLVIVDTLAKVRPADRMGESAYAADYRFVGGLKELVDSAPGAAMVLVHHTNKRGAGDGGDFLDSVSGTQGIAGAADATIVLSRPRKDQAATLAVTGRDVPEAEYAAICNEGVWTLDGVDLASAAQAVNERKQTANLGDKSAQFLAFVNRHPAGVTPSDVDAALGTNDAKVYLSRLYEAGKVSRPSRGLYTPVTSVASVTSDLKPQVEVLRLVT